MYSQVISTTDERYWTDLLNTVNKNEVNELVVVKSSKTTSCDDVPVVRNI